MSSYYVTPAAAMPSHPSPSGPTSASPSRRRKATPVHSSRLPATVTLNMAPGPNPGDISVVIRQTSQQSGTGSPNSGATVYGGRLPADKMPSSRGNAKPAAASAAPRNSTNAAWSDEDTRLTAPSLELSGDSSTDGDAVAAGPVVTGRASRRKRQRSADSAPPAQCQPNPTAGTRDSRQRGFTTAALSASSASDTSSSRPSSVPASEPPARLHFADGVTVMTGERMQCQSCRSRVERTAQVVINPHHHVNPFYSSLATYAMSNANPSFLIQSPQHIDLSGKPPAKSYTTACTVPTAEPVSLKPTTASIPVEKAVLCIPCLMNFRKHRLICDECDYVPSAHERHVTHCSRCFDGVLSRH